MKKGKVTIIIILVIIAAVAIYFFWHKKKMEQTGQNDAVKLPGQPHTGAKPAQEADAFPLTQGSRGKYVLSVQQMLNTKYKAGLKVDSILGPATLAAMKKYLKISSVANTAQFNALFGK